MKTLEDFILEIKQEMVHVCCDACKGNGAFPYHTGSGHYDHISHIPASLDRSIRRQAIQRLNAYNAAQSSSSSSSSSS